MAAFRYGHRLFPARFGGVGAGSASEAAVSVSSFAMRLLPPLRGGLGGPAPFVAHPVEDQRTNQSSSFCSVKVETR